MKKWMIDVSFDTINYGTSSQMQVVNIQNLKFAISYKCNKLNYYWLLHSNFQLFVDLPMYS